MAVFAAVELRQNAPSIVLIIHVGQHVKGFRDTSQGREGGNSSRLNTVFCSIATQRPERLTRFGLSLHQDKTRLVECGRFAVMNRHQRGVGKPETFDFLGFTHYCTTTRRGRFRLGRKPIAKRVNRTLARIDEVLRKRWHHDIWEVGKWLGRVCEGWLNYFAVPGSSRFIRAFLRRLQRRWMRALRRRSQRACFDWRRLERMTEILWPRASIRHPWPDQRFAVNHPR